MVFGKEGFDTWQEALYYLAGGTEEIDEDLEFYAEIADQEDKVLEIGCGTGRILLELLEEDLDVYGVDISEESLETLLRRAEKRGLNGDVEDRVMISDMRELSLDDRYSLIIVPSNNFLYNTSTEEQVSALKSIRRHLVDGGKAVFDFYSTSFDTVCEEYGETQRTEYEKEGTSYALEIEADFVDEIEWIIEVERRGFKEGEKIHESTTRQKHVPKTEFELLLEKVGFSDWEVYGGYNFDELKSPDQQMIWMVEK